MKTIGAALLVIVVFASSAIAQRLPLRTYTSADGLAGDQVIALLADSRGFLWIGTTTGLTRFDGREFRSYGAADGLPNPYINALLEDRDGVLWVGTHGGVVRIEPEGRGMSRVSLGEHASPNVFHLLQTRDGRIWVTARDELYVFPDERHRDRPERVPLVLPTPLPPWAARINQIESLVEGRDGDLWIGTSWGLIRRLADGRMIPMRIRPTAEDDRIYSLAVDRDGRVWITHWGIAHLPGIHFGVYVFMPDPPDRARAMVSTPSPPLHDRARRVTDPRAIPLPQKPGDAIYITAGGPIGDARVHTVWPLDNAIWIATEDGLVRIEHGLTTRYAKTSGLGIPLLVVARDARGDLWIGSRGLGLLRLEVDGFVTYSADAGFTNGEVVGLVEDGTGTVCLTWVEADNRVWFGAIRNGPADREALVRFMPRGTEHVRYWGWGEHQWFVHDRAGEWWVPTGDGLFRYAASPSCQSIASTPPKAVYARGRGLPGNELFRVFEDSRGDLWLSVETAIVRWRRATESFEIIARGDPPTAFTEDRAGQIWIGYYHGGIARWHDGELRALGPRDGVPEGFVHMLYVDSRGRLWIGAERGGLARIDDPTGSQLRVVRPTGDEGFADTAVFAAIEDRQQQMYFSTARGMLRFALPASPGLTHVRRFTTTDGLTSQRVRSALLDRHGRVWFGTQRGLSRVTPRPEAARTPPPIFIDSVRVDGVPQQISQLGARAIGALTIDPDSRRLEIGYGSPSLTAGDPPRYQVRLNGVDPDWGPASANRTALYLNLAPGTYRFEARAAAADGLTSMRPASVTFRILPPIWQRAWFQALVGAFVIAIGYLAYRSRINRLLALERVRARIATDLHDDLGARLSRISILSEVAARRVASDATAAQRLLGEVGETARSLIEATADITWSVDPRQDDLASLAARIRRFAADVLDARDIAWTFDAPQDGAAITLSPEHRRHVLLVFQEAINNVLRHAQATRVSLALRVDRRQLHAEIADDGCGFELRGQADHASTNGDGHGGVASADPALAGRGLSNMATRARELGGELCVTSAPGQGTRVRLSVPLARMIMRLPTRRPRPHTRSLS